MLLFLSFAAFAQTTPDIHQVSAKINKSLPQIYDHATKLMRTTVENNNFYYHFMLKASKAEYAFATPKVKSQIMNTICSRPQEKAILTSYNSNIVYRYESDKGEYLGEFMVKPEHCSKKKG